MRAHTPKPVRESYLCSFSAVCLFALLTFGVTPALAQDPPDVAQGLSPSATYDVGDFDSVDMTTGRVHIHIPVLVDHSQRGKLNFTYSLTYTSTGAIEYTFGSRGQLQENLPKYGWGTPRLIADGSLQPIHTDLRLDTQVSPYQRYYASYTAEADLSIHPINGRTLDGSGILAVSNGLMRNDGVSFNYLGGPAISAEDPNGNEITTSVQGLVFTTTDTLGRIWTTTFSNSNVTGCPTGGPVAPSYSTTWTVPGPANVNGGTRTYKVCYSTYTLNNPAGGLPFLGGTTDVATGLVLPDGTTWRFDYANNNFVDLVAVYPPTGGSISYSWETIYYNTALGYGYIRAVTQRTLYDGTNTRIWKYNPQNYGFGVAGTNTVTDPLLNDTVYTNTTAGVTTQIQYYSGSASSGTLLKTVAKSYQALADPYPNDMITAAPSPVLLTSTTTIWPNGQQSKVSQSYDSGFTYFDSNPNGMGTGQKYYTDPYGLVTSESHYDYGNGAPGPIISTTNTGYKYSSDSRYVTANLMDFPSSVVTTDGSNPPNVCAETDYGYDEYSLDSSSVTKQHVAAPNPVMGNGTSVTRQYFSNRCTSPTPPETPYKTVTHYFDTGMKHTVTDPNQNTTTYAYSSSFYGAYVTQTTLPPTNSINHIVSGNYDFPSGLLTSFTDQNNNTTSYTYDILLRPTNVTYPPQNVNGSQINGQTNFYYPNTTTVEMKKLIDGSRWTDSYVYYDGLGRETRRASINDESVPYDQIDSCYDADGRTGQKTYPYQGNGGAPTSPFCSKPGDTLAYDALNRTTGITHSDGTNVLTTYTDSGGHTGRATSVQDEGNGTTRVQRISQVDGMGRLTSVCEVSSVTVNGFGATPAACSLDIGGTGFLTTYTYDPLGDLTGVSQGGYLPRSFTYDSLSRLVTSSNPEAGTMSYTYDPDGNVITKTDARGITTCVGLWNGTSRTCNGTVGTGYDALNRPLQKTYSDTTPSVTFNYDQTSALGVSLLNTTGRASSFTVAGSQAGEVFSYDALGHVTTNSQCTPQNCGSSMFSMNYTPDLLGDMTSFTDAAGVKLSYTYNRALRVTGTTSSLSDSNHPGTLYSSPHYNAAGSVISVTIGNPGASVSETRTYDGRLRLATITDGSVYGVSIPATGGYAPDSDILQAIDSVNGTWSYSYDEMNRLCNANKSATSPTCHNTQSATYNYGYDRFGNLWSGIGSLNVSFTGNNNRIDQLSSHYDAAGNLLSDGYTAYTYDAESRVVSEANAGGTVNYSYDADGRRIRKNYNNGGVVDYVYDLAGHTTTMFSAGASWSRGEIYAGGRHLGTYDNNTTYFSFADWLGSERARSTSTGAPYETCTNNPFGDGLTCAGGTDFSPMHLTGKEFDPESGLSYFGARYDSSQYGRFMTPDWSAKPQGVPYAQLLGPQSLDLYAYVGNNPVGSADPDGHCSLCLFFKALINTLTGADQPPAPASPPPTGEMEEFAPQSTTQNQTTTHGQTSKLKVGDKTVDHNPLKPVEGANGRKGTEIFASPEDCDNCRWAQTVTRTGQGEETNHTDSYSAGYLLFPKAPTLPNNLLYDKPSSTEPGTFSAVSTLGVADESAHTFRVIGSMTWGYSLDGAGNVTTFGPRVSTATEQAGSIRALKSDNLSWSIN